MDFKEKIIQYWFIFVLTFLGFSKALIIVPVFLQLEISNYYLVGFINLVFWPAEYIYRIFESFAEANGLLMFAMAFLAIVRLALFALEAYALVFLLLKIFFNKSFQARSKELIGKKIFELKEKSSKLDIYNSERNIKSARNYLPLIVGFMLIFSIIVAGYYVFKNYRGKEQTKTFVMAEEEKRDNQRLENIVKIKEALDNYAKEHKGFYPATNGVEKISDAKSSSFLTLQNGNYISKLYADPLPDKYYYGYVSGGKSYELTAVLENQKDKCVQEGDMCMYKINGVYVFTEEDMETGAFLDRCEFPKNKEDYILEFIKTENMKDCGDVFSVKYNMNYVTTVQYSGSFVWGDITIAAFSRAENADSALEEQVSRVSDSLFNCEFSSIKGLCIGGAKNSKDAEMTFIWKERNTIRSLSFDIILEENNKITNINDRKKIVKKAIELFTENAKNCNVDITESYAAPYLKRMSF